MEHCARCGHSLGVGRFCTNCGHAIDRAVPDGDEWRSSTAERPPLPPAAPPPATPPPAFELPPQARFPLFADEVDPSAPTLAKAAHPVQPAPAPAPPPTGQPTGQSSAHGRRSGRGVLPWIAVAAVLALVAGVGTYLLLGGGDDSPDRATDRSEASQGPDRSDSPEPTASDPGEGGEQTQPPPEPDPSAAPGEPRDVASLATATPPATASPSRDVKNNVVRYDAFYMLDGQPDTAWRMGGKGTGYEVSFVLDGPTELTEVGLINGYAKVSPGYDGYTANRRILEAEWVFADGTVVPQTFADGDRGLQTVPVGDRGDGVVTDTVALRILKVSRPAKGDAGRDYTAISDVSLVGKPV